MNIAEKERTLICDEANKKWQQAESKTKTVRFFWNGIAYKSTLTLCRMLVESIDGRIKVCRYHR